MASARAVTRSISSCIAVSMIMRDIKSDGEYLNAWFAAVPCCKSTDLMVDTIQNTE